MRHRCRWIESSGTEKRTVAAGSKRDHSDATYERNGGCTVSELAERRFEKLQKFVGDYGVVCALKDARTLVAAQGRQMFLNTAGNSAMAKAGSGDVLAGVIAGLLAQHMSAYDAAVLGVYLHACGGDEARKRCGAYSVLAQDLTEGIKICIKETKRGEN